MTILKSSLALILTIFVGACSHLLVSEEEMARRDREWDNAVQKQNRGSEENKFTGGFLELIAGFADK